MRRPSISPAPPRPEVAALPLDGQLLRLPCVRLLLWQLLPIRVFPWLEHGVAVNLVHDAVRLTVNVPVVRAMGRMPGRQRVAPGLALAVVAAQVA